MKKVLWLIVCLMTITLTSCNSYYDVVESDYEVCYPDGTKKFTTTSTLLGKKSSIPYTICCSDGGTNYLLAVSKKEEGGTIDRVQIISTTAPIRLNGYKAVNKIKEKKNRSKNKRTDDVFLVKNKKK